MNLQWTHHLQLLERWEKRSKNCTKCWAKQSNDCSLRGEKTKKEEVSLSAEAGLPNIGCYFYSLSKMQKRKARNQKVHFNITKGFICSSCHSFFSSQSETWSFIEVQVYLCDSSSACDVCLFALSCDFRHASSSDLQLYGNVLV